MGTNFLKHGDHHTHHFAHAHGTCEFLCAAEIPQQRKLSIRVLVSVMIGNAFLGAFKLLAGIVGHSSALVSDSIHTLVDFASNLIALVSVCFFRGEKEKALHSASRWEGIAGLVLGLFLFLVALGVGWKGVSVILFHTQGEGFEPGVLPLVAALLSIGVKEGMFWYTRWGSKMANSPAMLADAWHSRSDALISVGSFAGVLGARFGWHLLDPIASLAICCLILRAVFGVLAASLRQIRGEPTKAQNE